MKAEVAADIRAIFNTPDRTIAEALLAQLVRKYAQKAARLSAWMETNQPEGLTVFSFPDPHRCLIRTTSGLERASKAVR